MEKNTPLPHAPADHPLIRQGKVGVLLINLGTPDRPEAGAVRRYLREFLSDRRVVDLPRPLWLPVLHGIILNTRPSRTAKLYKSIWHEETDESPLRFHTKNQAEKLKPAFGESVIVDWAMRYGNPSIEMQVKRLQAAGCTRILAVPLYPQYSATTTGTVMDQLGRVLMKMPWQPTLRLAPPFHDEGGYIHALEASLRKNVPASAERVILSFHGIPERYFRAGDPYHCHCQKTARLVRERMGWTEEFAPIGFQSKFGPEKWLEPATEDLVKQAAEDGVKHLAIAAPAFVADCIETLEEIGIGLKETFKQHGGEELAALPCLNSDDAFIMFLTNFCRRELGGWID